MKICGIYFIKNKVNGKLYIGSSCNIHARWSSHISELKRGVHHSLPLQRAWNKYGKDAFHFQILEEVLDLKTRLEKETALIALHKTANGKNGYNCLPIAGSPAGYKVSDATKARMSAAQRAIPLEIRLTYCRSFVGRKHSEETLAKMRASSPRRKMTEEQKAAVSRVHKGKTISPEQLAIMSVATAKRNKTSENRAKVSAALKGRVFTDEWKLKLKIAAQARSEREKLAKLNLS